MAVFLRVLPTRWRRGSFAYKMAAFLKVLPIRWRREVLPTRRRHFWEFYPQDDGVGVLPTIWWRVWGFCPQDGGMWVLPARWWRFWEFKIYITFTVGSTLATCPPKTLFLPPPLLAGLAPALCELFTITATISFSISSSNTPVLLF